MPPLPMEHVAFGCDGFTKMWTGRRMTVLAPQQNSIHILDIAHALSNLCRFGGHTDLFYSVAEHSIVVSYIMEELFERPDLAGVALMHDASEAYLTDMQRPVKVLPEFEIFKRVEEGLEAAIAEKFGIPHPLPTEVKRADNVALIAEVRRLMNGCSDPDWTALLGSGHDKEWPHELHCYRSGAAKIPFVGRFLQLCHRGLLKLSDADYRDVIEFLSLNDRQTYRHAVTEDDGQPE